MIDPADKSIATWAALHQPVRESECDCRAGYRHEPGCELAWWPAGCRETEEDE